LLTTLPDFYLKKKAKTKNTDCGWIELLFCPSLTKSIVKKKEKRIEVLCFAVGGQVNAVKKF